MSVSKSGVLFTLQQNGKCLLCIISPFYYAERETSLKVLALEYSLKSISYYRGGSNCCMLIVRSRMHIISTYSEES